MEAIEQADPTAQLADYLEATRCEQLPAHVIAAVRKSFLDTIGAGIAGRSTELDVAADPATGRLRPARLARTTIRRG